jgi:biopolymer transport protein ExbD
MKIKRKTKPSFLESSAASDVAFLLIIYFMVIAGFNTNKGFIISLPAKDSAKLIFKDDLLRFEMDEKGQIFHKGEILAFPAAQSLITGAQISNPNIAVILSVDGQAYWQNVVYFVELAQDLNIDSFSFTMKKGGM